MKNLFGEKMGIRQWIAWKLVCIAHKLYDATYWEVIKSPDGFTNILIEGDEYGGGVSACMNVLWCESPPAELEHLTLVEFDDLDEAMEWAYGTD